MKQRPPVEVKVTPLEIDPNVQWMEYYSTAQVPAFHMPDPIRDHGRAPTFRTCAIGFQILNFTRSEGGIPVSRTL